MLITGSVQCWGVDIIETYHSVSRHSTPESCFAAILLVFLIIMRVRTRTLYLFNLPKTWWFQSQRTGLILKFENKMLQKFFDILNFELQVVFQLLVWMETCEIALKNYVNRALRNSKMLLSSSQRPSLIPV